MSEAQLFEKIGRLTLENEQMATVYNNALNLLALVVRGDVARSRVMVNVTNRSWVVAPENERPTMPATVNGFPICFVAPAEPEPE